jgi:phage gp36-like protein
MGTQYCTPTDVGNYALNPIALSTVPMVAQTAACVAASEHADSHFRGRYPLPLLSWGIDVTMMTSYIAAKLMIEARGASPMNCNDESLEKNYDRAIVWFKDVQRQTVHPDVTFSQPAANYILPQVNSPNSARGW